MTDPAPSRPPGRSARSRSAPRLWALAAATVVALGVASGAVVTPLISQAALPDATARFTIEAPADPARVSDSGFQPSVTVADRALADRTALELLATLPVKGKAPRTGYDRADDFGQAWLDVDRNGCDTRNDILARDLTEIVRPGTCKVLRGTLAEPYTGKTVQFVRGNDTSALVQIDHVVALSNAWQTGAQQLTQAQRVSFANDPLNLLAADGLANAQKGDGDAATWLPKVKSFRCAYVARQVSVKATYGLWVAPAERDAMARVLSACPSEPALSSPFAANSVPTPAPPVHVTQAPAPPAVQPAAPVPAPAPAAPAPAPAVVHPGSFCSPAGAVGVTSAGTAMVCGTTPKSPDRARWHRH